MKKITKIALVVALVLAVGFVVGGMVTLGDPPYGLIQLI